MSAAEPRRATARVASLALVGLFVAAFVLRLVGLKTGSAVRLQRGREQPLRAARDRDVRAQPEPGLLHQPAGVHVRRSTRCSRVRWGTDPASIGGAFAADPTSAFTLARGASAFLGALAVPLTAIAGARLFDDRRVGFVAGALLAVAFLPVHYSHFALNDAPTLAPLALCLVGVAGIYRTGRTREYVLAGRRAGGRDRDQVHGGDRARHGDRGGVRVAGRARARAQPGARAGADVRRRSSPRTRTRCSTATRSGTASRSRPRPRARRAASSGSPNSSGWTLLPRHVHVGLRLAAVAARARRHRRAARAPPPARRSLLAPAPVLLFLYLGEQSRFFARWMLPIYPILAMLAAWGVVALVSRVRLRVLLPVAAALAARAGARVQRPQRPRAGARRHAPGRARLDGAATSRRGTKIVVEPIAPDQWAADVGEPLFEYTGSGNRWNKFRTSRSCFFNGKRLRGAVPRRQARGLRAHDRARSASPSYERGGFCWVVTGSNQFGRAYADPDEVPDAIRYYDELRKRGDVVFRVSPYGRDAARPVLVRLLVQLLPADL